VSGFEKTGRWASLTAGVVLAGGMSRRMGGEDKAVKTLGGVPLVARAVERLKPQVGRVAINSNGDPARFVDLGCDVVADSVAGFAGPLAGVLAGMQWARHEQPGARWIVTAATDTPFFPHDLVDRFVDATEHDERVIALARSGSRLHPVFGLWPVLLIDDLRAAVEDEGIRKVLAWTDRHRVTAVDFPFIDMGGKQVDPFFNTNTPEDLATAQAMLDEGVR
jgi:molybdopterin-guanine dinucleotide biosynthesis protein A